MNYVFIEKNYPDCPFQVLLERVEFGLPLVSVVNKGQALNI